MKLEYTDEETFITEEVEFSDEHYKLVENLHKQYANCSPIMVRKDKQSLVFCVNFGSDNVYKVIIEKINVSK